MADRVSISLRARKQGTPVSKEEIVMHSDGRASIVLPPALLVARARRELPVSVLAPE